MEVRGNKTETVRQGRAGQGRVDGWLAGACACAGMGNREEVQKILFCAERCGWVGLGWKDSLGSLKGRKEEGGGMIWVGGEKMWNFLD